MAEPEYTPDPYESAASRRFNRWAAHHKVLVALLILLVIAGGITLRLLRIYT